MNILITGGAGFIGSHLVRHFVRKYSRYRIYNLDALTYAGNLENLKDVEHHPNYTFLKGNILDADYVLEIFGRYGFDRVIHLAAESHVDRSISGPSSFLQTNVAGTVNLLDAARETWNGASEGKLFCHISTDEVFGSLPAVGKFNESSPYAPNSPYAASKAASDHFVRAYGETYGLPAVISNCSNNYGPNQFPEKFIPLFINNIIDNRPLPLYGDGNNSRDWLHVSDHIAAIDLIFHNAVPGETYCVGGDSEWKNRDLALLLCSILDEKLRRAGGTSEKLITFVEDRQGHDFRYAINANKIKSDLGWSPKVMFEDGIRQTIAWYLNNASWLERVTSGAYREYYKEAYEKRGIANNQGS